MSLARAVEFLVKRGHNEHDVIHSYSIPKIMLYQKIGIQNMIAEMKQSANAMRNAFHANKKQFETFIETELQEE